MIDESGRELHIAGIVLASGFSSRFGSANKLLQPVNGDPIVRRAVCAYLDAGLAPVVVVTGYEELEVRAALTDLTIGFVSNPDYRQGLSRALSAGVRALPPRADAAVIGVGDQPFLTGEVIRQLVARYRSQRTCGVVATYAGQAGNPALFDRILFPELLAVVGDQGGRPVIARHAADFSIVDMPDGVLGWDIDSADDYSRVRDR
jgi:molybdenum cofactor cytidylyltransferase